MLRRHVRVWGMKGSAMSNDELRLKHMELVNFRKFGRLDIDFDERLTVLVGDNGSGKTAVLDAAAIALGTLLTRVTSPFSAIDGRNIDSSDMRLVPVRTGSVTADQPQPAAIHARASFRGRDISWVRTMNEHRRRGGTLHEAVAASQVLQNEITGGDRGVLPVIAYYGTGRLWLHKREKKHSERFFVHGFSRANGYIDCLDSANNEKLMLNWFERMTAVETQRQQLGKKGTIPELDAVRTALSLCFRDLMGRSGITVMFDLSSNSLMLVDHNDDGEPNMLPFGNLSDGYRGTLSLIADIAYRMAVLNPDSEDILSTPGVVLIDEIDLHLHPRWQERIVHDLQMIFPRVQFIVSTHAPLVISTVKASQLRGIRPTESVQADLFDESTHYEACSPTVESYGHDVGSILEDVMDANERPAEVKTQLRELHRLLDEGNLDQAEHILGQLERILGSDDHAVVDGRVSLDLERMDRSDVAH